MKKAFSIYSNEQILATMKSLIILFGCLSLSFAALAPPEHLDPMMKTMHDACVKETGVDEKYIEQSREGYIPDNPLLGCYILCLLEHCGMIEPDGRIHFEKIVHMLPPDVRESADQAVAACSTKHGSTRCETALLTMKCFHEAVPKGARLP